MGKRTFSAHPRQGHILMEAGHRDAERALALRQRAR
jgi:hypothetical protein